MNVWKLWAESKGLNDDIVDYKAKELDEYPPDIWPKLGKAII